MKKEEYALKLRDGNLIVKILSHESTVYINRTIHL